MSAKVQMKAGLILTILGLFAFGYNNCSKVEFHEDLTAKAFRSGETIVGNPLTASQAVLDKICHLVSTCHPSVTPDRCEAEVLKLGGFDYQLGLKSGSVQNFSEIIQSETSGQLVANSTATSTCLSGIDQITCSDTLAQNAYDSATDSFAGTAFLIPTTVGSCPSIFNQPATLKEYYVAINGDDSADGSAAHPWASITHASQALNLGPQGTTVHVGPGTYTLSTIASCGSNSASCGVKTNRSGTSSAPITYISDQSGAAKITAPGASAVWYNSGDYVRIIGFEIQGSSSSNFGIFSEAAFGDMISNHIHDIPVTTGCATNYAGGGIFFGYPASAHDNNAIGNRIHDIGPHQANGLPFSSYCQGMALGISYDQARGKIQNNIIYSVASWAISSWHAASNLQITNNLLFNNGNVAATGTLNGGGVFISGEAGVGVNDNTIVSNNIVRNNSGRGIAEFGSVGKNNLYLNNLMYQNSRDFDLISGAVPANTISADPLMASFAVDGSGDYRLTLASPAIDSGTLNCAAPLSSGSCTPQSDFLGVQRPIGSGLDIGPFEWHP